MVKMRCLQPSTTTLTLVPLLLCLVSPRIASKEEYMSGAISQKEPDNQYPIMYQSVIPLLYKFSVPDWNAHSMKIQFWKEHNNCTKDDKYESGYPCPILYHMHPIVDSFRKNMTSWTNLFVDSDLDPFSISEYLSDPSLIYDKQVCSMLRLEPHFRGLMKTSSSNIMEYVKIMSQCAEKNGTVFNLKIVRMDGIPSYVENLYHETFASFTADYWNKFASDGAKEGAFEGAREGVALTGWTALQSGLLAHQNMEAQKWIQAVETCKNSRVPWTLISGDSLQEQISILRSYLASESKDVAIPLEDVYKYFQLPLTDCIFGEDNTFLVRILVPVVPKEAAKKSYFVRFHPVSFAAQGKICSLWEDGQSIPFNVGLNGVLPCTCDKSQLFCKGWNSSSQQDCSMFHRLHEKCIHAVASDSEEDILQDCPLRCRDPPSDYKTELRNVELLLHKSDTTTIKVIPALLGPSNELALMVKCQKEKMVLHPETTGAYELILPADCDIYIVPNNTETLNGTVETIDLVQVEHVMPYHWRKGVVIEEAEDVHEVSLVDQLEMLNGVEPKLNLLTNRVQDLDQYCRENGNTAWLWIFIIFLIIINILLSIVVGHLFIWKVKQVNDANRHTLLSNAMDFPISDDRS